jgi:hypothetical protein
MKKKLLAVLVAGSLTFPVSCQDFLDVNTNPNGPQTVTANLYLPPMLHWMVTSPQYEGRFIGRYTQQWFAPATTLSTWDRMGYDVAPSDNGAQQWRDVYWSLGQNLVDMMDKAEAEERWDLLGVGKVLKAWGWLALTGTHGEIIIKEAVNQGETFSFNYDSQEFAYQEVERLLREAIVDLGRTDGAVNAAYLGRTDKLYAGDRTKWLKLAHGMLAITLNHYSNKASYKPADVISEVNLSFASNADEALLSYTNTSPGNEDGNFLGRTRNNHTTYRQTRFVVDLMNGTSLGAPDPRMSRMLAVSPDGQFRGLDVNVANFGALTVAQQPNNFFGYAGTGGLQQPGRYIFDDKAKLPAVITYAGLQFIKAEAAYRAGDKATALQAYTNGISAHIDWVNARNTDAGQSAIAITAAEKSAFLANPAIVPTSPAGLNLTMIMSQKYIALWGWGHNEIWMDMRRYHYTDIDPASGKQVYPGFTPPTSLFADNAGKVAQRIRPRYNSEYVWNRPGLDAIGGLASDYHTKPLWITNP